MNLRTLWSPAFLLLVVITAVSFIGRALPEPWDDIVRWMNSAVVLYVILWLAFRSRVYEKDLEHHRDEILDMLRDRERERDGAIKTLRETASALKDETARIAASLAEETRIAAQTATDQFDKLSKQVATGIKRADETFVEANSVNKKMEDTKSEIENLNKRLIEQVESHATDVEVLGTIQKTTAEIQHVAEDSHRILKQNVAKKLVDGGQLDDMQVTGDESHAMLKEQVERQKEEE